MFCDGCIFDFSPDCQMTELGVLCRNGLWLYLPLVLCIGFCSSLAVAAAVCGTVASAIAYALVVGGVCGMILDFVHLGGSDRAADRLRFVGSLGCTTLLWMATVAVSICVVGLLGPPAYGYPIKWRPTVYNGTSEWMALASIDRTTLPFNCGAHPHMGCDVSAWVVGAVTTTDEWNLTIRIQGWPGTSVEFSCVFYCDRVLPSADFISPLPASYKFVQPSGRSVETVLGTIGVILGIACSLTFFVLAHLWLRARSCGRAVPAPDSPAAEPLLAASESQ